MPKVSRQVKEKYKKNAYPDNVFFFQQCPGKPILFPPKITKIFSYLKKFIKNQKKFDETFLFDILK